MHAAQDLLRGQLAYRAVDSHARHAELLRQYLLGGDRVALFPMPGMNFCKQVILDALKYRHAVLLVLTVQIALHTCLLLSGYGSTCLHMKEFSCISCIYNL